MKEHYQPSCSGFLEVKLHGESQKEPQTVRDCTEKSAVRREDRNANHESNGCERDLTQLFNFHIRFATQKAGMHNPPAALHF
jgi:hypothetical protein